MTPFLSPWSSPQQVQAGESSAHQGLQVLPWRSSPITPPGGAGPTELTHQHLSYAVLLPDIAEVTGHVGLKPDVLPIRC